MSVAFINNRLYFYDIEKKTVLVPHKLLKITETNKKRGAILEYSIWTTSDPFKITKMNKKCRPKWTILLQLKQKYCFPNNYHCDLITIKPRKDTSYMLLISNITNI